MHGVLVTSKSPEEIWVLRPPVRCKLELQQRSLTPLNGKEGPSLGFEIREYLIQYLPVRYYDPDTNFSFEWLSVDGHCFGEKEQHGSSRGLPKTKQQVMLRQLC